MMYRRLAVLAVLMLGLVPAAFGAGLILTNAQEQSVEAWHRSLIESGLTFPNLSGMTYDGQAAMVLDTFYLKQGQVAETCAVSAPNGVYYPIMWVDDPQYSINVKYLTTWGRGVQTAIFLQYPDSAMPTFPGGPYSKFIVSRPTGDTGAACVLNLLGFPLAPR